jgi:methylthioribose-1-phosphate isomerase
MTHLRDSTDKTSPIPPTVRLDDKARAVIMLDQTLLPAEARVLRLENVESVAEAISSLRVRGAPAIGIAAAMGIAVGLVRLRESEPELTREGLVGTFRQYQQTLVGTRPTAVNLAWALDRTRRAFEEAAPGGVVTMVEAVVREAKRIALEDETACRRIGEHGLSVLPPEGATVLTHCNAGALATGGVGTALAPVYAAHEKGIPVGVFAGETRPLLQGARLTAWELTRAGIEVTLVTDSMAGALMAHGRVNLVIVGADRVAANGDVANKIGTYALAVLARHHGLPFYVALPRSTFDPGTPTGSDILIEERDPSEITAGSGWSETPSRPSVFNPAFDVTPAHLVTAFITDQGVLRPPHEASIAALFSESPLPFPEEGP